MPSLAALGRSDCYKQLPNDLLLASRLRERVAAATCCKLHSTQTFPQIPKSWKFNISFCSHAISIV
eukprot:3766776-Amphidinium_carterae.1